jgi:hypothetical protein
MNLKFRQEDFSVPPELWIRAPKRLSAAVNSARSKPLTKIK